MSRPAQRAIFITAALALTACGSDAPGPSGAGPDGGADAARPGDAASGDAAPTTGARLAGTVRDKAGALVQGAKVEAAGAMVFSDAQGRYELPLPTAGAISVKASRDFFKPLEQPVTAAPAGATPLDLVIEEIPLTLAPGDAALAERYAKTFDWTRQTISIAVAAKPTRRDFDNAVYFRNPALYREPSKEPKLTPSPLPSIAAGVARNFSFPLRSGPREGQEALNLTTLVDAIEATPLSAEDRAGFMIWSPTLTWLGEWDTTKAAALGTVGVAVRQQSWGGNATRPQEIDRLYVHGATGTLWVEIVFAGFVEPGAGITDDDGDGRKEVFAKIQDGPYGPEVVERLTNGYRTKRFDTHGLSREIVASLNALYSTTAAQVERTIGQPFEVPGVGTIEHPFVVLRHAGGQRNVVLVAPGDR
jgi:hypothetical protein